MANDEVDRRSAILNAAVECFGTLGYYGTSLQRIATMVNLTKPGVLHYIGSKEGLLHQVLTDIYARVPGCGFDMHAGNFMFRPLGRQQYQLVLTDPMC